MSPFRMHLCGLPHTEVSRSYEWCAYTAKTRKFADMMTKRGHEVILYAAGENCEADCAEFVRCNEDLPPNGEIPEFNASSPLFAKFNERAIAAIRERVQPRDLVLLIGGLAQEPIARAAAELPVQVVEYGIGYGGIIPWTHHVYESYAWMHLVTGAMTNGHPHASDGRFFDAVIPNYFDVQDFPRGCGDGGYLLYVGRLIERKGVQIALDVAEHSGLPLKVAGAGDYPLPDRVDYRGVVGPAERARLMGDAIACLAPTTYVEPFGGTAVEAQLCGTPAITTDFGAFTETVEPRWRRHTLSEFLDAVDDARELSMLVRERIRARAIVRYSTDAVAREYERYFKRLSLLWEGGWYQM